MSLFDALARVYFAALHIGESNTFPKPLKQKEEEEYLERMENGDDQARKVLIERNLRLVMHIIKKYYSQNAQQDDLISIGTIGLIKGINTFDRKKGVRLATYASRCIENEILMYFRSRKKTSGDVSLSDPIETDADGNPLTLMDLLFKEDTIFEDLCYESDILKLRGFVKEISNKREKDIIVMRYGLDGHEPMTQSEVAKVMNISRSYVSRLETKCLKALRKRLENE